MLEGLSGRTWQKVGSSATDGDSKSGALMAAADYSELGLYWLVFEMKEYSLGKHGPYPPGFHPPGFYPRVVVEFEVKGNECGEHFHVPLLLSPSSYTTYRGKPDDAVGMGRDVRGVQYSKR